MTICNNIKYINVGALPRVRKTVRPSILSFEGGAATPTATQPSLYLRTSVSERAATRPTRRKTDTTPTAMLRAEKADFSWGLDSKGCVSVGAIIRCCFSYSYLVVAFSAFICLKWGYKWKDTR